MEYHIQMHSHLTNLIIYIKNYTLTMRSSLWCEGFAPLPAENSRLWKNTFSNTENKMQQLLEFPPDPLHH